MTKLNITQGEWITSESAHGKQLFVNNKAVNIAVALDDNEDVATLIADAGNTYQETGKLPSELARLWQVEVHVAENLQNRWVEQAEAIKELVNILRELRCEHGHRWAESQDNYACKLINKYGGDDADV